ncbi:hypothetical protein TNIN_72331 [Trichonephila inaurata madagascariensis]|uniref:Uncharacterized protein n=1 Tax=Trichonephila inaurata madagascariensis TaxID=2747483 RepID=A0A8X6YVP5_9ARAC|nr:hypothetical protein TNIN_72331 [Trichonephila inaurata madagascariensis]
MKSEIKLIHFKFCKSLIKSKWICKNIILSPPFLSTGSISLFSIIKSRLPAYRISGTAFQNIGIPTGVGGDTSAFNQSASATCLEASLQANPTVRRIREEKRKGYPHQTKHWQFSSTQRDIGHSVTSTPDPFLSCKLVLNTPPLGSVPRQGMLFF